MDYDEMWDKQLNLSDDEYDNLIKILRKICEELI